MMNHDVNLGFSGHPFSIKDEVDRTHSLASGAGHSPVHDFERAIDQSDHGVLQYWQVPNGCLFLESKHLI